MVFCMIIAITGYPKAGKSTVGGVLAVRTGKELISTDQYIDSFSFSDTPSGIIEAISDKKDYIIEGVAVARMLKRGFNEKTWAPDKVYWVFGGETKNPISKSTFNAFKTWFDTSNLPYEIIWDLEQL